ncbi:MAG: GntR family transcriptional regulator [Paracoccaceae bacterium]
MHPVENNVERLYQRLRQMAADFEFKPEERINESVLSKKLGASRTPLREALNRLVAEGFLTFRGGKGFYCRPLSPDGILHLYEARVAIECEALRCSTQRASDTSIGEIVAYLDGIEDEYTTCRDPLRLLDLDESFHLRLAELSDNPEFVRILNNINGRIRFVRMLDLTALLKAPESETSLSAHRRIVSTLQSRNETTAIFAMRAHIQRRREQATDAVRRAFAEMYVTRVS